VSLPLADRSAPQKDQILDQRYRLVRLLGSGGCGSVWQAEHLALHSPVAIKLLDPAALDAGDTLQRFLREARAAAALRSQHVVQILDYGVDSGMPFIVMELLDGESLEQRLARRGQLDFVATERVLRHTARAVARAHEAGIIHRDLKPGNVFIVPNDEDEVIKVLDFGVAKTTSSVLGRSVAHAMTPAGALLGTPHYMSPEQVEGSAALDHRTDLWAMGVMTYECLLGRLPFDAGSFASLLQAICRGPSPVPSQQGDVPLGFDGWFARACARSPDDRFASAKELAAAFSRLGAGSA
jgi:serine/threonine protein kinase